MVIDEAAVPKIYWEPSEPRLNRQELASDLKQGEEITGVTLSNPEPGFEREDTVMGFSAKQVQALRRNLDHRHVRTREANGRELSYIEGWYAITEANRIFGFDGWNRETIESRCVLARENRGTFLAVYIARVRITVHADGATIIREGHGTGEGRGYIAGRSPRHRAQSRGNRCHQTSACHIRKAVRFGAIWEREDAPSPKTSAPEPKPADLGQDVRFARDDTTPIPRPSRYYGRRQDLVTRDRAQGLPKLGVQASADPLDCPARTRSIPGSDR